MVTLRPCLPADGAEATRLCLRSKAHWRYDAAFMAACAAELTVGTRDLDRDPVILACDGSVIVGVAQVSRNADACHLEKLFVDPGRMGQGVGRQLFRWSLGAMRDLGARRMIVEADPGAVPFYLAMGCVPAGTAPSGSIPGRFLPRLVWEEGDGES